MREGGTRRDRLERMLLTRESELLQELEREFGSRISGDDRDRLLETIEVGDRSVTILGQDVDLSVLGIRKDQLREVRSALRRLRTGDYGVCEDCGSEIDEERLEILPFTSSCVDCKRRSELAEGVAPPTGFGFRSGFGDVRNEDEDEEEPEG